MGVLCVKLVNYSKGYRDINLILANDTYSFQILLNLLNLEFPNPAKPTKHRIPIPFKP